MRTFITLVDRNRKLFFRDKGMLLSSLITPMILIVLYATFLAKKVLIHIFNLKRLTDSKNIVK